MTTLFVPLIVNMLFGIFSLKIFWIATEIREFPKRLNFQMFKTNFIEIIILVLQIFASVYTPLPQTPFDSLIVITGVLMYVAGFVIAVWGKVIMSGSWGIPGVHDKKQDELIVAGPFKFSRNPIYVGFTLLYLGFAIAIKSWLVILRIPLIFYFYKSILKEEKLLEKKFGSKYLDYKSKTPRFISLKKKKKA